MKRLIFDLDDTICFTENGDYKNSRPNVELIEKMRDYQAKGFEIVIFTSRNMRTYQGNIGKINAHTLPVITEWLIQHSVPFDELHVGKAWCGFEGFYIDDKAIRPDEFVGLSYDEIIHLVKKNSSN